MMHSYVSFLIYPNIRRCTVDELTPSKLKYVKADYSHERTIAKKAGFAIKPSFNFQMLN